MQNLSETNINMQKEAQTEQGRSMVETLGVLAIIGVLAIGGIMGYKWAMDKYVANQIANEIRIADLDIATSLMTKNDEGITLALEKPFGDNKLSIADTPFDYGCTDEATLDKECVAGEENYHMTLGNISKGVCQKLLEMTPYTQYYVRQLVGDTETVEGEACQEEMNDIVIFYNIETGYGAGGNSDEVDECPPETPLYNEETGECEACPEDTRWNGKKCIDYECRVNSDCNAGEYCHMDEGAFCDVEFETENNTSDYYTGECRLANSAFQIINIDKEDGTTAKLYVSNEYMTWWSAQRFCDAIGKRMMALGDLGCADAVSVPVAMSFCHGTALGDATAYETGNVSSIIEELTNTNPDGYWLSNLNDGSCHALAFGAIPTMEEGMIIPGGRHWGTRVVCVSGTEHLEGSFEQNSGNCPANVPNWDAEAGACTNGCDDINAPSFNVTTGECEACPGSQQWDMQKHDCVCTNNSDCPTDKPLCDNDDANYMHTYKCVACPFFAPVWNSEDGYCDYCPDDAPNWNGNTCEPCSDDKPVFNYDAMKCEACPEGMVWYDEFKYCECAEETAYLKDDGTCEVCPNDIPLSVWQGEYWDCEACPEDTPVWNGSTRQCESCSADKPIWNADTKQCEESPCEEGFVYGYRKYDYGGQDSEKACWPCGYVYLEEKPYWNGTQCTPCPNDMTVYYDETYGSAGAGRHGFKCYSRCWDNAPVWNETTQQCEACPDNKPKWNASTKQCEEVNCEEGFVYGYRHVSWGSQDSEKACWPCGYVDHDKPYWNGSQCTTCPVNMSKTMDESYGSYGSGKYGYKCEIRCGDDAPVWNAYEYRCEACPSDSPVWNATNRQCEACPDNKPKWNSSTKQCEEANCEEGFVYGYRQYASGRDSEKACWPCGYVYHDKPYWNGSQCIACPSGMSRGEDYTYGSYDSVGYTCWDRCWGDTPVWNETTQRCEACPDNKPIWNSNTRQCEESDCPEGFVYGYRRYPFSNRQDSEKACWPCGYVYQEDKPYWNGSECTACPSDMHRVVDETYGSYYSHGYKCVR